VIGDVYTPFVLEGNLGQGVVGVCEALLNVLNSGRVAFRDLLALVARLFLVGVFEQLQVAHTGKIENLKGSGKVIFFLFLFFLTFCSLQKFCWSFVVWSSMAGFILPPPRQKAQSSRHQ
jgi:hypothetical protein